MIYVVTAGSYSDYHIEACFKDKEKAELYCKCNEIAWRINDNRIRAKY